MKTIFLQILVGGVPHTVGFSHNILTAQLWLNASEGRALLFIEGERETV
jgi:hypothetical protein